MAQGNGKTYKVKLSKGQSDFVRMASKTIKHGNKKKKHLDWRKAKKYFGKHTKSRDSFASGWLAGGAKLDHASASTIKRLKNYKNPAVTPNSVMRPMGGGTNCTGVTKHVHVRDLVDDYYYDSCDTIDIMYWLKTCAKAAGALFALTGWKSKTSGGVFFLIAAGCGAVWDQVDTAQQKSNVHAFIWRTIGYHAYPNGQINTTYELIPQ